jgi:hypothetical protein
MIVRKCLTCLKDFSCYPSARRKYCSSPCVPVNVGNSSRWKDKIPVEFSCVLCSAKFSVRPSRAKRGDVKYCSFRCKQVVAGRNGGAITGTQRKERAAKLRPEDRKSYPKIGGRHAHRVVAEKKLGRALLPGEVVHHDDENKQNYSEDNLIILPSQAAHARLHVAHMLAVRKPRKINNFPVKCEACEKEFFVNKARLKTAKHCSRLCHNRVAGRKKIVPTIQ